MKRFTVLGLCLMTAFAISVLVASGASAAKTEHGEMVVTSSGGEAHLGTEAGSITSTSNHGKGNLTGPGGGTSSSDFEGVEAVAAKAKCNSAGKPEGNVETFPLSEGTGWISKAKNEAGVDFKPASGEFLAEFVCGPVKVKVKGSVIGHVTPLNTASLSTQLNLIPDETKKANSPHNFEGGPTDVLLSNINGSEVGESLQQQENVTVTNHGNSTVCKVKIKKGVETEKCKPSAAGEFYTLNGSPEFGRCDKKGGASNFTDSSCTVLAAPGKKGKYGFVPLPG